MVGKPAKIHDEYMTKTFGEKWTKCIAEGRCWVVQDRIFNPYDGQGLDLLCLAHDCHFNIPTARGDWNVPTPACCPHGAKNKLN